MQLLSQAFPTALALFVLGGAHESDAFFPIPTFRSIALRPAVRLENTALKYTNSTDVVLASKKVSPPVINDDIKSCERRDNLKNELAKCSIENYDFEAHRNGSTFAENIMKELEPLRPWAQPAQHPGLNARFSFVFTGVPTIGMKLITLLSRISVGFPVVEFHDVFLEVSGQNTKAKAIVTFKLLGIPIELNVDTNLCADKSCPNGTMMIEQFQGITLQGYPVPTPESWNRSRTLEITYLDEDMMIARTAGGEPHFLLRHSSCSTDDERCDMNSELTDYFEGAKEKYGDKIARCLVDRKYGEENECGDRSTNPLVTVLSLEPGSLFSSGKKESSGLA